jgi:hypothetical protein
MPILGMRLSMIYLTFSLDNCPADGAHGQRERAWSYLVHREIEL